MSAEEQRIEHEAPPGDVPGRAAPPAPEDVDQVARPPEPTGDDQVARPPEATGVDQDARPPEPAGDDRGARPPEPTGEPGIAAAAAPEPSGDDQVARPPEPGVPADAAPEPVPVQDALPAADDAHVRARADKADEYLALAQRTQADFENYRKRMLRDVRAAEARGMGRLAKELLPALDNLDRAVAALDGSESEHHLADGIRLVTAELAAALQRTGIQGYAAKGERFDPVCHEAVAQTPVDGAEPGTIVEVLQAGYRLNEAILRPARVVVAG